jgi:hypothetical protein
MLRLAPCGLCSLGLALLLAVACGMLLHVYRPAYFTCFLTEHSGLRHRMAQPEELIDDTFRTLMEVQSRMQPGSCSYSCSALAAEF